MTAAERQKAYEDCEDRQRGYVKQLKDSAAKVRVANDNRAYMKLMALANG